MSLNSSVLCETESIPFQEGLATSTQIVLGVSQPLHTSQLAKLCTTGERFEQESEPSTCEASPSGSGSQKLIFDSSGEENSDEEQDVDISGITTSTEDDAAGHNSKGDGERLDNPCPPPTIPSNGPLPWQFNDILVQAIETNTLAHHESRFTRACGRHLLKLRPEKRTKSEYKIYSKIIVDRFPYFKHECSEDGNWVVFKDKLTKMIGNYRNALAHGDENKKKRLLKKEAKVNEKVTLVNPNMSCTDFEERNALRQRREQIQKNTSHKLWQNF